MITGNWALEVLAWLGAILWVVCVVLAVVRFWMPMGRLPPICLKCGYAMEGLPAGQANCPECGKKLEKLDREYRATWRAGMLPVSPSILVAISVASVIPMGLQWGPVMEKYEYVVTYETAFRKRLSQKYGETITMTTISTRWETRILVLGSRRHWEWVLERSVKAPPTLMDVRSLESYNFLLDPAPYLDLTKVLDAPAWKVTRWPLEQEKMAAETRKKMTTLQGHFHTEAADDEIDRTIADLSMLYAGQGLEVGKISGVDRVRTLGTARTTMGMAWWAVPLMLVVLMGMKVVLVLLERRVMRKHLAAFNGELGNLN